MHKLYLQSFESRFLDPDNEKEDLATITSNLPRRAARRMSTLGILLHSVLEKEALTLDTTVIYGTTYTEANALESFLESMPYASPTAFQTSIHPGGIEQALILRKQALGPFLPMAGETTLVVQMLKAAFTATTPEILLCGGEEQGGWLREFEIAYPSSFAFSMRLSRVPLKTGMQIEWDPEADPVSALPSLEEIIRQLEAGNGLAFGGKDHGRFKITPE